jgi:hypothetical protein
MRHATCRRARTETEFLNLGTPTAGRFHSLDWLIDQVPCCSAFDKRQQHVRIGASEYREQGDTSQGSGGGWDPWDPQPPAEQEQAVRTRLQLAPENDETGDRSTYARRHPKCVDVERPGAQPENGLMKP